MFRQRAVTCRSVNDVRQWGDGRGTVLITRKTRTRGHASASLLHTLPTRPNYRRTFRNITSAATFRNCSPDIIYNESNRVPDIFRSFIPVTSVRKNGRYNRIDGVLNREKSKKATKHRRRERKNRSFHRCSPKNTTRNARTRRLKTRRLSSRWPARINNANDKRPVNNK